ncbi:MAG: triose-phosphate isomerase [Pseudomonadota bacterium]
MRRKLAAGNWKMNGTRDALAELTILAELIGEGGPDVVICPPATLIFPAVEATSDTGIGIGAQDCHSAASGAHTGDIAAEMIADAGGSHAIVGHSERRADHGETDAVVHAKTEAAWAAGLVAILCIGESLDQREAGKTLDVIGSQLAQSVPDVASPDTLVIAYEPIWAIGTGKVATLDQIIEVHDFIRETLVSRFGEIGATFSLLYGGSVKAANATEIFTAENVDGALVGGASLKAADFAPIVMALANA